MVQTTCPTPGHRFAHVSGRGGDGVLAPLPERWQLQLQLQLQHQRHHQLQLQRLPYL